MINKFWYTHTMGLCISYLKDQIYTLEQKGWQYNVIFKKHITKQTNMCNSIIYLRKTISIYYISLVLNIWYLLLTENNHYINRISIMKMP